MTDDAAKGVRHLIAVLGGPHRAVKVPNDHLADIWSRLSARESDGSGASHLCQISAEVSGTSGAGIMVLSGELARGSLCTTDGVSAYIDDLQFTLGEGPSIDAHRDGRVVDEPDMDAPEISRWQLLSPVALQAGVKAMFGFPIRIGAARLGAMNLYRDSSGPLDADQYDAALVMSEVAARTMLAMQGNAPPGTVAVELETGANFHLVVHQAAGMISVQLDIGVTEALVRLRAHAFGADRPIDEVARDIVDRHLRLADPDR